MGCILVVHFLNKLFHNKNFGLITNILISTINIFMWSHPRLCLSHFKHCNMYMKCISQHVSVDTFALHVDM